MLYNYQLIMNRSMLYGSHGPAIKVPLIKTSKYNNKTRLIKKMKRPFFFIQVVSA